MGDVGRLVRELRDAERMPAGQAYGDGDGEGPSAGMSETDKHGQRVRRMGESESRTTNQHRPPSPPLARHRLATTSTVRRQHRRCYLDHLPFPPP